MIITKAQITRRASKERVPAKTVERDYVLAHAVAAIVASGLGSLVFKGGTALRLIHFEECRYSADLDYSLVNGTKEDALVSIREAFAGIHESQVSEPRLTDGERPRIAYVGPLGKERTLKLDIADDEHVVTTEKRALLPRWPDLPDIEVPTYTLLEIASEKLRCILQRLQCRDLFDLDVLLNEFEVDAIAAAELFRDKARHRGLDPTTFADKYTERVGRYKKRWDTELEEHVPLGGYPISMRPSGKWREH